MTLRAYLLIMIIITSLFWAGFAMVVYSISPDITNWVGFTLFYLSLFLAISGTASILGFIIRFIGLKHELAVVSVKAAFRQSFLFAALIIISLLLLASELFSWINLLLLILGLSVLEYFLLSYTSHNLEHVTHNEENDLREIERKHEAEQENYIE